ncbi:DUF481 domain-containing protein [Deminuibacter soli]|uniref:DUF481 domain-containing protein n=1 Tax=Deminuibacter soli TaxID=2291815 RepID=A0A3E1NHT3_9BACT|nr:DUF481 domain-containing protein [Deminuibacter soli]RFM27338.1 DUF481 domain-containing protein [Deminuibacter soli]
MRYIRKYISLLLLNICCLYSIGQKNDKVYLTNGDILTGEIKGMKLAILTFKMDGPGTISIKWEKVNRVVSVKVFDITLRHGEHLVEQVDSNFFQRHGYTLDDIVEMVNIENRFVKRFSGSANAGCSYAKSGNILQLNFSGSVTYRVPSFESSLAASTIRNQQLSDSTLTRKQDVKWTNLHYLKKANFITGELGWQENTELGIANRFLLNGAFGKTILANNHNRLLAAAGLSLNTEQATDAPGYTKNLDALVLSQYKRFYNTSPKLSLETDFYMYPALSDWGRIRLEIDVSTKIEVFHNFTIGLTFYDNYDSRPPAGASSTNDYNINFTVGYEFGN